MNLKRPCFNGRPIGSIAALAKCLGVSEAKLARISSNANRFYRGPILIKKKGRKPREVYSALPALRDIQQRILDRILVQAVYPDYLLGGIKGRSYVGNARLHAGSKTLFGQDVDSFYPSITAYKVQCIFQYVFRFPSTVSRTLAALCCRGGVLVQGGVSSTHLANLALHKTEPELERSVRECGRRYSRFVDDMHVSDMGCMASSEKTRIMGMMRSALERHGFKPKRTKQFVAVAGKAMKVHGLNVNGSVSSPGQHRQQLRNEVFLLERWADMQSWDANMERSYISLSSRIGQLVQLNPGEARRLKKRLLSISDRRA